MEDPTDLVAHDSCQMFQKFLECSELLSADGDDDALVELVGVDEEANLLGAFFGRDVNQRCPMALLLLRGRRDG